MDFKKQLHKKHVRLSCPAFVFFELKSKTFTIYFKLTCRIMHYIIKKSRNKEVSFILKKTIFIKSLLILLIFCNILSTNIISVSATNKILNPASVELSEKNKVSSPVLDSKSNICQPIIPLKGAIQPLAASAQAPFSIGIDVSKWNGDIDWKAVANSGVQFAIIRTSFGWSNREKYTDIRLRQNIDGAKSVGMPIGAYHYSYAKDSQQALMEADFFIDRLKWSKWEYPVCLDIEDKNQKSLPKEQCTDVALTFLNRVSSAGYYTGVYTYLDFTKNNLNMERLKNYDLWIAHWHSTCGCKTPYAMWQYTSSGSVPGINSRVDLDYAYKDYPNIIKSAHLNGF